MQKFLLALAAACISVSAAQALTASPLSNLRSDIANSGAGHHVLAIKDTSKPGSPNTSQFQAQRTPPDNTAKQNKPAPKTGGIPASVVAPKPKR